MFYDYAPALLFIFLVLALVALALLRTYLVSKRRLQVRELVHRERMQAIERGTEIPDAEAVEELLDGSGSPMTSRISIVWLRLVALCVGLAALFGGVGMCVGFLLTNNDLREIWSLGLMPAFVGFGLLLFYIAAGQLAATIPAGDDE